MMKEVLRSIDPGLLPFIGLLAFVLAFALIITRVVVMSKKQRDDLKNLPLDEPEDLYAQLS